MNAVRGSLGSSVTEPKLATYAADPSCTTLTSTISYLEFVASAIDIKYFALRYVA